MKLQGQAQGTYYSITYYDTHHRNLQEQVDSLLSDFDMTASLWNDSSIIRRINSGSDSVINPLFRDLLDKAQQIRLYTQGAFDCRIGSLVNLYGFGFKQRGEVRDKQVDSLLSTLQGDSWMLADSVYQHNRWQYTLRRLTPIEYDFNAIAQGYSVDLLAQMFDSLGVSDYLIDVGGEVIARGGKPDGSSWAVGIERPAENQYSPREIETVIGLRDQSVVTSGNYRKYYEHDGVRYSHTINPATGKPVGHSLLSVSVVSRQSWYADAIATAFMVMGLEQSLQFIQSHPDDTDIQAAFFIYDDHGQYRTHATPAFEQLILER